MTLDHPLPQTAENVVPASSRVRWNKWALGLAALALAYFVIAYVLVPMLWNRYERRHPWLSDIPGVTYLKDGHPGDPLNVALAGESTRSNTLCKPLVGIQPTP